MRIFYRSPTMVITDRIVRVAAPAAMSYQIDKVDHLYAVRAEAHVSRAFLFRRMWPLPVAMALAMLAISVNALPGLVAVAVVAPFVALASVMVISGRMPTINELWAVVNGRHVCLFRSADDLVFGQVHRAMIRAVERRR